MNRVFLSGIGRGQMTVLDAHISHHKHVQALYEELLADFLEFISTSSLLILVSMPTSGSVPLLLTLRCVSKDRRTLTRRLSRLPSGALQVLSIRWIQQ